MRIHLKRVGVVVISLLFLAVLAWAKDEPWKGKPYDQWNKKDLERIFTDSPWSRVVAVTRTWTPITAKDLPEKPLSGGIRQLPKELERSSETSVGGELNINVYWASSRVMRAASARKANLIDGKMDADATKYAAEPQEEYQIVVQSTDMAPFFHHDEKYFQTAATLQMKRSKVRLSPSHVHYERDATGTLVTTAVFYFPKKTSSGAPTISADEKNAEFSCKLEGTVLQTNFDLQKMTDSSGPDL
ncbi:MAG TPA: hypothetical protein VKD70_13325 [Candidatus Acidoferrum sp.]|nr:hypothetical protein [Candidatus Acidoferrum sp.]